jgi:hypothetical protein
MSNKPFPQLIKLDQVLRRKFPIGMRSEKDPFTITIEKECGFELHNDRPYHNYETFSDGWILTYKDDKNEIEVRREDLDDAISTMASKLGKLKR